MGEVLEVVPEELLQNRLVGTDECFRGVDVVGEVPHGKKRRENVGVAQAVILVEVNGLAQFRVGNALSFEAAADDVLNEGGVA